MSRLLTRCPGAAGCALAEVAGWRQPRRRPTGRRARRDGQIEASSTPGARAPDWRRHGRIPHRPAGRLPRCLPGFWSSCCSPWPPCRTPKPGSPPAPVAYTFRYDAGRRRHGRRDDRPGRRRADARALVMPRAIPMGYGEQRYDAFVTDVARGRRRRRAHAGRTRGGPALAAARRARPASSTASTCGSWSARCGRRRISRACATATWRALGYSVFAFVDGYETRPVHAARRRARTAGRCSARSRRRAA